jgi:ABC-type multidrug transport system ATPase subunit
MENNIRLLINNISVVYSDVIQVLKGVSLTVKKGQIVSLLGSNGAGKTTTLKAISGLLKPENGKVTEGSIEYDGKPVQNSSPEEITRKGIIQVLEGRGPPPAGANLLKKTWKWFTTIFPHCLRGKRTWQDIAVAVNSRCS